MRFKCDIIPDPKEPIRIPVTYRQNFLSLIKQAIRDGHEETYQKLYGEHQNVSKPFTYSVTLPPIVEKAEHHFICTPNAFPFYFSTSDFNMLTLVYNGLNHLPPYPLFKNLTVKIAHFFLMPKPDFSSGKMTFKTVSPVVVRKIRKDQQSEYLTPDRSDFDFSLKKSFAYQCSRLKPELEPDIAQTQIEFSRSEVVRVPYKEHFITAVSGIVEIEAPPDILELIYDTGIGGRRSMGFGMVEEVR